MKALNSLVFPLGLALALLLPACDTTEPVRRSDANAQLDSFFGGGGGGEGMDVGVNPGASRPAISKVSQGNKLLPGTDKPKIAWDDPCFVNLDEINGELLLYYQQHKALPETLEELPRTSLSGAKISLTCPVSGKHYAYFPQGLRPPVLVDQNNKVHAGVVLLVYDPEPVHKATLHLTDGKNDYDMEKMVHFAIFMDPVRVPGQPVQTYTDVLEPALLEAYMKMAEQSVPVRPLRPAPGGF